MLWVSAAGGAHSVEKNVIGGRPTGCWWCDSVIQAEVFKSRAVPQGLCENLINALKLLANQQKDGDNPVQNIVTSLCERSRKGINGGPEKLY